MKKTKQTKITTYKFPKKVATHNMVPMTVNYEGRRNYYAGKIDFDYSNAHYEYLERENIDFDEWTELIPIEEKLEWLTKNKYGKPHPAIGKKIVLYEMQEFDWYMQMLGWE